MKTVTQAEFSRICNVNRSTVSRWIKNGRIRTDEHGRIDPEAAQRLREATESQEPHHQARKAQIEADKAEQAATQHHATPPASDEQQTPGMETVGVALKLETLKLQKAKAEKAAMEVDKLAGSLVERSEVEFVLADFGQTLRGLMEGLPDRMTGPISAHKGDSTAIHRSLEEAASELLAEISSHMQRKMEALSE